MKKIKSLVIVLFVLLFPGVVFFTGCGATPVNGVNSVKFVSDIYDEETGYAVFEVDYGIETELTYKVNPSIWSGYDVRYEKVEYGDNMGNVENITMSNGKVKVISLEYQAMKIKITIGKATDTCIVRLKKYPTSIFFKAKNEDGEVVYSKTLSDFINVGAVYDIHVYGQFEGEEKPREINDKQYKFLVENTNVDGGDDGTLDKTVLSIINPTRLKVCTIKNKIETSTVKISLCDTTGKLKESGYGGEEKYVLRLELTVVPIPTTASIRMDGYDNFIENSKKISINLVDKNIENETISSTYQNVTTETTYYTISYDMQIFNSTINSTNYISDDEYTVKGTSNQQKYIFFEYDEENNKNIMKIRQPSNSSNLLAELVFSMSLNDSNGDVYQVKITVDFKFVSDDNNV